MIQLKGIAAAGGISIGPAYMLGKEEFVVLREAINWTDIPTQIQLFEEALIKTRREIIELQKRISLDMGQQEAQIFDAHLLVLEDRMLIEEVISRLKKEQLNVAYIFSEVLKKYIGVFLKIEDEYLKERAADINDVGKRILRNLLGNEKKSLADAGSRAIIVAHDISPSDTAAMYTKNVAAFVTDIGGKTSHTAIMAKSLEIPAVVGLETVTAKVNAGDILIVDGSMGIVIINPDEEALRNYQQKLEKLKGIADKFLLVKDLSAVTTDGRTILINANIELPDEVPSVKLHGGQGIGLYRTEFFYMNRKDSPSEEEHYQAYRYVAEEMNPHSVVIRTLDIGGDKFLSQFKIPHEMQPFLGWRAIRFCLARPDIFKLQLRAILRASVHGNLKLMYPMISGVEELRQANHLLDEAKQELRQNGLKFNDKIEVGVMVEVPSAAMTADILAKEADFFSIGTNDLIQYSLAVDRSNEKVAYLYDPAHPAVLRLVKRIIDAAHQAKIKVAMCGEMAGEPSLALILLGLGLDEFSLPPQVIPELKYVIRAIGFKAAQEIAYQALQLSTGKEVEEFSENRLAEILK
ncbi:MAG: phosphoenolpyruvate--protein phosphotransferase [Candidatus Omnitrophica bacterium]|nr:phosphoenolpyruvate--protein phosphotransferase [Candidatus Omnitrophota bacterium]MBU4303123.1 phosphoenolpyruvate--protein phosphotransferase [Candidatus Omnitrophota bacterium]MBU4418478.1 phosphoenolpyruvate--protein phosphotransferase [Candidatus Omnitrophota bacterium]MBU4467808.1 phosphoenolpyruvate--protein phosphotransferase [Candidatus Omnitrophota bacterium]MCG2708317.1 phosphoenolpyruvate--protein phosphotransferase [Candidatus Omnitrophota bacterium]